MYVIRDIPNAENDQRVAKHVLALQGNIESISSVIDNSLLRKYIAYAKQNCFPSLGVAAAKLIQDYYVKIRGSVSGEGIQSIPISARQLQAIVRLAEASARVRLSKRVTEADAKRAIRLVEETLKQLGTDPETGKIDIDRITTGITATTRNKMSTIRQIIETLESQFGKSVPKSEVINEAESQGIEKSKSDEILSNLLRSGDLFEPKAGFIQRS
jgi:replicative DNA helicase Mcm